MEIADVVVEIADAVVEIAGGVVAMEIAGVVVVEIAGVIVVVAGRSQGAVVAEIGSSQKMKQAAEIAGVAVAAVET